MIPDDKETSMVGRTEGNGRERKEGSLSRIQLPDRMQSCWQLGVCQLPKWHCVYLPFPGTKGAMQFQATIITRIRIKIKRCGICSSYPPNSDEISTQQGQNSRSENRVRYIVLGTLSYECYLLTDSYAFRVLYFTYLTVFQFDHHVADRRDGIVRIHYTLI